MILPGLDTDATEYNWSQSELIFLAVEHYLLIALYASANILMYINIWNILFKQKRYKTLPLLFFYIFTFIALTLRLVWSVFYFAWIRHPKVYLIVEIATVAKLCVGLVYTRADLAELRVRDGYGLVHRIRCVLAGEHEGGLQLSLLPAFWPQILPSCLG